MGKCWGSGLKKEHEAGTETGIQERNGICMSPITYFQSRLQYDARNIVDRGFISKYQKKDIIQALTTHHRHGSAASSYPQGYRALTPSEKIVSHSR